MWFNPLIFFTCINAPDVRFGCRSLFRLAPECCCCFLWQRGRWERCDLRVLYASGVKKYSNLSCTFLNLNVEPGISLRGSGYFLSVLQYNYNLSMRCSMLLGLKLFLELFSGSTQDFFKSTQDFFFLKIKYIIYSLKIKYINLCFHFQSSLGLQGFYLTSTSLYLCFLFLRLRNWLSVIEMIEYSYWFGFFYSTKKQLQKSIFKIKVNNIITENIIYLFVRLFYFVIRIYILLVLQ